MKQNNKNTKICKAECPFPTKAVFYFFLFYNFAHLRPQNHITGYYIIISHGFNMDDFWPQLSQVANWNSKLVLHHDLSNSIFMPIPNFMHFGRLKNGRVNPFVVWVSYASSLNWWWWWWNKSQNLWIFL